MFCLFPPISCIRSLPRDPPAKNVVVSSAPVDSGKHATLPNADRRLWGDTQKDVGLHVILYCPSALKFMEVGSDGPRRRRTFRDSRNQGGASKCEAGGLYAVLQFVAHQVELFVSPKEAAHWRPDAQEEGPRTYPIVLPVLPHPQQMQYVRIFSDQQGRRPCISSHRH